MTTEKVKETAERVKKKIKHALLTTAIVGAGVASVTGVSSHIKKEEKNNRINAEWKKEFADADTVFADAKTAHFYAEKKNNQQSAEELEVYLQRLKNEKRNQMGVALLDEFTAGLGVGRQGYADKLLANGAKAEYNLMKNIAENSSELCEVKFDRFEMLKKLFEQYEKYGGCKFNNPFDITEGLSGRDWEVIKQALEKRVLEGDTKYKALVEFASNEVKKAKKEGRYFEVQETSEFNQDFYKNSAKELYGDQVSAFSPEGRMEILNLKMKKTLSLLGGDEYKIDVVSKEIKDLLADDEKSEDTKKSIIAGMRARGEVKGRG